VEYTEAVAVVSTRPGAEWQRQSLTRRHAAYAPPGAAPIAKLPRPHTHTLTVDCEKCQYTPSVVTAIRPTPTAPQAAAACPATRVPSTRTPSGPIRASVRSPRSSSPSSRAGVVLAMLQASATVTFASRTA